MHCTINVVGKGGSTITKIIGFSDYGLKPWGDSLRSKAKAVDERDALMNRSVRFGKLVWEIETVNIISESEINVRLDEEIGVIFTMAGWCYECLSRRAWQFGI